MGRTRIGVIGLRISKVLKSFGFWRAGCLDAYDTKNILEPGERYINNSSSLCNSCIIKEVMPRIGKNKIRAAILLLVLVVGILIVESPFAHKAKAYGITFVNSTNGSASLTTGQADVISVPSGVLPGDLLIAEMTATSAQTFATPTGWTLEHHNTAFNTMDLFYRVADGTETSTYSFVISGNANSAFGMAALRGVDQTTPFLGVSADTTNVSASSLTVPTVSWAGAADVVSLIDMHASWTSALTITWPSGWDPANGFTSFLSPSNDYVAPNLVTRSGVTSLPTQTIGLSQTTNSTSNQFAIKVASAPSFPTNSTVLDNFNRANADPMSNPMSGGDSWALTTLSGGSGAGARLKIVSNTAEPESTIVADADYDTTAAYGPDTEVYATVTATGSATSGTEIGSLYARLVNAGGTSMKAYELQINKGTTSNWLAYRFDSNSTFTELGVLSGSTGSRKSQTISAGDSFGMRITGTGVMVSIEAWYKPVSGAWTSLGTWTDGSAGRLTAAGKIALEIQGATTVPQIDDLSGGTVVVGAIPAAPTLNVPAAGATGVSTTPQFQMRATDANNDYLRYKIDVCSASDCSTIVRTIDQTSSQTGWSGQDQQTSTAYTGNSVLTSSTMAAHTYQAAALSPGTQYWWRAYAIDPGGSNTFSTASSIQTFTTNNTPATPTIVFPAASATGISTLPLFSLRTTDAESDYIKYFFQIYSATACGGAQVGSNIDQTSSQTNWQGQDASSGTAYIASSSIGGSTIARYQYAGGALTPNHLYSWRAKAIDPGGTNTFSSLSSCQDFTTNSTEAVINGGVNITGGTTIQ